jgi:hypothetical protein
MVWSIERIRPKPDAVDSRAAGPTTSRVWTLRSLTTVEEPGQLVEILAQQHMTFDVSHGQAGQRTTTHEIQLHREICQHSCAPSVSGHNPSHCLCSHQEPNSRIRAGLTRIAHWPIRLTGVELVAISPGPAGGWAFQGRCWPAGTRAFGESVLVAVGRTLVPAVRHDDRQQRRRGKGVSRHYYDIFVVLRAIPRRGSGHGATAA